MLLDMVYSCDKKMSRSHGEVDASEVKERLCNSNVVGILGESRQTGKVLIESWFKCVLEQELPTANGFVK